MTDMRRVLLLILIMFIAVAAVESVALALQYGAAFDAQRQRLIEMVNRNVALIESMARFDSAYQTGYPGGWQLATLTKLQSAQWQSGQMGAAEVAIARREADELVFLLTGSTLDSLEARIPMGSDRAEPMRRALDGQAGVMEGRDYAGFQVLAAYRPVPVLGLGVVAKVRLDALRAPYYRAGAWSVLATLALLSVGALAFLRVTEPMLRRAVDLNHRYEATFTHAGVGIAQVGLDGRPLLVNDRLCEMMGCSREVITGLTADYAHPEDLKGDLAMIPRLLAEPSQPQGWERRFVRPDGTAVWVRVTASTVLDAHGQPAYFLAVLEDVSRRVEAETELKRYSECLEETVRQRTAELEEANRQLVRRERLAMLGQLAGGVGHELRNPLGVISNAAYYLRMVLQPRSDDVEEYLNLIGVEVGRCSAIIGSLLGMARTPEPDRRPVSLSDCIAQAVRDANLPERVRLEVDANGAPPACADAGHLRMVLGNLITNAVQAMPDGGVLRIASSAHACRTDRVRLTVSDTGPGIPSDVLPRIFEPLFTTRPRGIGLGLAIAHNLVEANGGTIQATSEPGRGTVFEIELPAPEGGL